MSGKKPFYGWWVLSALVAFSALGAGTVWYGFTAFFKPLVDEFGWSYTAISLGAGMRGVEIGLGDLVVGFLVDRFGGRKIVLGGTVLMSLGFLLLSQVSSLATFYVYYFIVCAGVTGAASVVAMATLSRWFRRRLGTAFGIFGTGAGLGGLALPLVVYLVDHLGFRTTFLVFGVSAFVVGIVATLVVRDCPEPLGYGPDGDPVASAETALPQDTPVQLGRGPSTNGAAEATLRGVLRSRTFWTLVVMSVAHQFVLQMLITHIMPYLESVNYSRRMAGQVAMLIPMISLLGRLGFGWLGDRFNRRDILIGAMSLQTVGIFVLGNVGLISPIVLFLLFYGLGYGGVVPNRAAILRDYFGIRGFGSMLGVVVGLSMIGGLVGPVIAGRLYDTTGSYRLSLTIATVLLGLATLPLLSLKRPAASSRE